jgi:hypothetical protein
VKLDNVRIQSLHGAAKIEGQPANRPPVARIPSVSAQRQTIKRVSQRIHLAKQSAMELYN